MTTQAIKSQSILPRVAGIQKDIERLQKLGKLDLKIFTEEANLVMAQFYLRQALEGVFHIGSHILSRLPGGRTVEYKQIALKLGELGIVDPLFAKTELNQMAGYRNRLTHFYAEITAEEIYKILQEHLSDFDTFLEAIKRVMLHPEQFNLTIE